MYNADMQVISTKIILFLTSNKYFNIYLRKIVQLVEHWFPKSRDKGSTPFFSAFLN